ncbi:hypothetical protein EF888_11150 [Silicimonas algicola]|uniref:Uncharacterized protein n=1 Tax=Silicimonas algicola TaxID=1826607 RepID=A0A316FUB1_9RHOB|nr:hypothetical protein [Silicimonas algicola]AZQ67639.1 hypothetical protein EF888_11150 [Silicimonas algicola]PWK51675.1 hypothetical protein C8D95_11718 [Silicimonas algicola]
MRINTKAGISAAVVLHVSVAAFADTTGMCLNMAGMTDDRCACATEALAGEVKAEALNLYDAVGTRYLEKLSSGQAMVEAWDGAIAETASERGVDRHSLLETTNDVGKAHRTAILACD